MREIFQMRGLRLSQNVLLLFSDNCARSKDRAFLIQAAFWWHIELAETGKTGAGCWPPLMCLLSAAAWKTKQVLPVTSRCDIADSRSGVRPALNRSPERSGRERSPAILRQPTAG